MNVECFLPIFDVIKKRKNCFINFVIFSKSPLCEIHVLWKKLLFDWRKYLNYFKRLELFHRLINYIRSNASIVAAKTKQNYFVKNSWKIFVFKWSLSSPILSFFFFFNFFFLIFLQKCKIIGVSADGLCHTFYG